MDADGWITRPSKQRKTASGTGAAQASASGSGAKRLNLKTVALEMKEVLFQRRLEATFEVPAGATVTAVPRTESFATRSVSVVVHSGAVAPPPSVSSSSPASSPAKRAAVPLAPSREVGRRAGQNTTDDDETEEEEDDDDYDEVSPTDNREYHLKIGLRPISPSSEEGNLLRRGPRGHKLGSSDCGSACGKNPWKSAMKLWRDLTFGSSFTGSQATRHGHAYEDKTVKLYPAVIDWMLHSAGRTSTGRGAVKTTLVETGHWPHHRPELSHMFGCSPDRLVYMHPDSPECRLALRYAASLRPGAPPFDGDEDEVRRAHTRCSHILEAKSPYGAMYPQEASGMKEDHLLQVSFQMWVTGMKFADYVVAKWAHLEPDGSYPAEYKHGDVPLLILRIERSDDLCERWMFPRLMYMIKCLRSRQEPDRRIYQGKLAGRPREVPDYLWPSECPALRGRDDDFWLQKELPRPKIVNITKAYRSARRASAVTS